MSGYLQGQYQASRLSEDQLLPDGAPQNRDEFSLRSARLRVSRGYTFTTYSVELDATTRGGARVGLRRAEATLFYRGDNALTGPPLVGLSAGVLDIPFGYEVAGSAGARLFMERSAASEALFPAQFDVGVKAFGAWRFARYALALVNGSLAEPGQWERDPNAAKDLAGHLGVDTPVLPGTLAVAGGTSFSFGRGFHAGQPATKDSLAWRDDNEDGVATPTELTGIPGSAAIPSASFDRWAIGVDLQLRLTTLLGDTDLRLEGVVSKNHDRSLFISDPVATGVDLRQTGTLVELVQRITPYALVGARYATYDPNLDLFEQRRGEFTPRYQGLRVLSPLVGAVIPERALLLFQYDFVQDQLARDELGVPTDADNDQFTVRLQVNL